MIFPVINPGILIFDVWVIKVCYRIMQAVILIQLHFLIGHLVMSCNNAVFMELMDFLMSELSKNASISTTRTYIQCIGAITYVLIRSLQVMIR